MCSVRDNLADAFPGATKEQLNLLRKDIDGRIAAQSEKFKAEISRIDSTLAEHQAWLVQHAQQHAQQAAINARVQQQLDAIAGAAADAAAKAAAAQREAATTQGAPERAQAVPTRLRLRLPARLLAHLPAHLPCSHARVHAYACAGACAPSAGHGAAIGRLFGASVAQGSELASLNRKATTAQEVGAAAQLEAEVARVRLDGHDEQLDGQEQRLKVVEKSVSALARFTKSATVAMAQLFTPCALADIEVAPSRSRACLTSTLALLTASCRSQVASWSAAAPVAGRLATGRLGRRRAQVAEDADVKLPPLREPPRARLVGQSDERPDQLCLTTY